MFNKSGRLVWIIIAKIGGVTIFLRSTNVFMDCAAPEDVICALDVFYVTQKTLKKDLRLISELRMKSNHIFNPSVGCKGRVVLSFCHRQSGKKKKTRAEGQKKRTEVRNSFRFLSLSNIVCIQTAPYIQKVQSSGQQQHICPVCSQSDARFGAIRGTDSHKDRRITSGRIHTVGNSSYEDPDADTACYVPPLLSLREGPQTSGRPLIPQRIISFVNKHRGQTGVLPGHSCPKTIQPDGRRSW